MFVVIRIIQTLFSLYSICLIARTFLEMVIGPYHSVVVFLRAITEPVLAPLRRILPIVQIGGMGLDLAPLVALILLWILERIVVSLLYSLV